MRARLRAQCAQVFALRGILIRRSQPRIFLYRLQLLHTGPAAAHEARRVREPERMTLPRDPPSPSILTAPTRAFTAFRAQPRVGRVLAHATLVAVLAFGSVVGLPAAGHGSPHPSTVSPHDPSRGDTLWLPPFGAPLHVTGAYRPPPTPYTAGHRGIDIPAVPGSVLAAPAPGTVEFVGVVVDRGTLTIRVDADTVYSWEPIASTLSVGDQLVAGAPLGTAARGGHCATECVHLGVRVRGEYVSPLRYLLGRPVLLPWE